MASSAPRGCFAHRYPRFAAALSLFATDGVLEHERFIARNFQLDEHIADVRGDSYNPDVDLDMSSVESWRLGHTDYLERALYRPQPMTGIPVTVDPSDASRRPETFCAGCLEQILADLDPELFLVRIERIQYIAIGVGIEEEVLERELADAAAGQHMDPNRITGILARWARTRDLRPVFCGLWQDVADILPADASYAPPTWADDLRDRFGLAHLAPELLCRDVPVVVFRYRVKEIPVMRGTVGTRALAIPTVLDCGLSEVFCPTPIESSVGYAMSLVPALDMPARELLHAACSWTAEHVFRTGRITRDVPVEIADSRTWHLMALQDEMTRADFASATDADLM